MEVDTARRSVSTPSMPAVDAALETPAQRSARQLTLTDCVGIGINGIIGSGIFLLPARVYAA